MDVLYFSFVLIMSLSACFTDVDLESVIRDPNSDEINGENPRPLPVGPERVTAEAGLAMKFLDVKGNVLTSPVHSGKIDKKSSSQKYKFGMLFEITVNYTDDEGKAIADQEVRLQADNATIRQLHQVTANLATKTNADGIASFPLLYLIDATKPVTLIAEVDGKDGEENKKAEIEVSIDSTTPDCYATFNSQYYSNYSADETTIPVCNKTQKSDGTNVFVDIPSTCKDNIDDRTMHVDLKLYQLDNQRKKLHSESYNGSYNDTYGDCLVMPLSQLHMDTKIDTTSNTICAQSELYVTSETMPSLAIFDAQAGNGSCH